MADIQGFLDAKQALETANPTLDVDSHFSDIKDQNYAIWDASDPEKTAKLLWEEYRKKKIGIPDEIPVKEPHLW